MNVIHHTKLYLRQICNIVFQGNNQRPEIFYREFMNVMKAITGIPSIGRRKIMVPYSIHVNLQDITKTLMTEEKDKTPI
jgi:hypothetical protein